MSDTAVIRMASDAEQKALMVRDLLAREDVRSVIAASEKLGDDILTHLARVEMEKTPCYHPTQDHSDAEVEMLKTAVPTPWQTVNDSLGGGVPKGSMIMIAGYTGESKSTLAADIAADALAKGQRVYYADGEVGLIFTKLAVMRAMCKSSLEALGETPTSQQIRDFCAERLPKFENFRYLNADRNGRRERLEIKKIISTLRKQDPGFVLIVDYLGRVETDGEEDYYRRQAAALQDLADVVEETGSVCYFLSQYNRGGYGENKNSKGDRKAYTAGSINQAFDSWFSFNITVDRDARTTTLTLDKRRFFIPQFRAEYKWSPSSPTLHDTRGWLDRAANFEILESEADREKAERQATIMALMHKTFSDWVANGCGALMIGDYAVPVHEDADNLRAFKKQDFADAFNKCAGETVLKQKWDAWANLVAAQCGLKETKVDRHVAFRAKEAS